MTSDNYAFSSVFDPGDSCGGDDTAGDIAARNHRSGCAEKDQGAGETREIITDDSFVQDTIIDSITTLEGISQALGYRIAVFHDEMLELLSRAAAAQANELRELVEGE